jgi:hypothetical protein
VSTERRLAGRAHVERLDTGLEVGSKKTFQWVVDWPGWCRSGKTELEALERLIEYAERYNVVIERAGFEPLSVSGHDLYVVETTTGGGGTDFGVPSSITELDRRPTTDADADRLARIVEASWAVFDEVAAAAPEALRKGPRGGGRDRSKVVGHVDEADHAYARETGIKVPAPDRADPRTVIAMRTAMLDVLRQPSDGSPIAGRRWTTRYAARRVAWHALDHAWEIEDRSES